MSSEKDSKILYEAFSYYDRTGMQEFLEKKASEGWRLVRKVFAGEWEFEPMEPKKLHYAVAYLPQFSNEDEFLVSENKKEYLEMCSATGWQYVCVHKNMVFFLNEEENPLPLETDPEEELDVIHKAVVKRNRIGIIIVMAMLLLTIAGIFLFKTLSGIYLLTIGSAVLLAESIDFYKYLRWRKKALAAASLGKFSRTDMPDKLISCLSLAIVLVFYAVTVVWLIISKNWDAIAKMTLFSLILSLHTYFDKLKDKTDSIRKKRLLTFALILICLVLILLYSFISVYFIEGC